MQCPRAMRRTRRVCDSAGSAARAVWRRQSPSTTARQKKRRGRRRAPQPLRSCVSARHICSPTASTMLAHALSERSVSRGRSGSAASKHRLSGFSERWPPAVPRPTPTSPSDSWETRWPTARSWACVHMRRGATWGALHARTGRPERSEGHIATALAMFREMEMPYWIEKAEAELRALA